LKRRWPIRFCAIILLSGCLRAGVESLSAQGVPPGNLPQIITLIERREFAPAEARLQTELKTDPSNPTLYRVLGFVYQQEQRFPDAERALERSLELSRGTNPQALFLLVGTKFALKKAPEALALARKLSAASGDDPKIHFALGRLLRENGQLGASVQELESARAASPADPAVDTELVIAYTQQHDAVKAEPLLQSVLHTSSYSDLVQAGSRLAEAGVLSLAVSAFQRAVEAEPGRYDARFDLAFALLRASRFDEAEQALDSIPHVEADAHADYHYLRGKVALARARPQEAGEEFVRAVHLDAGNEALCMDAGLLESKFEDFWKALEVFQACAQSQPDSVPVETGLGLTYFQLGKYPDAIATFHKVVSLRPEADATREALGFILYLTSDFAQARQVLEPRLTAHGVDYYLPFLYALVLLRLDERTFQSVALRSIEQSIQLNGKFAPAYFQRGRLEWKAGETDRARTDLELAIHLDPAYAQPYYVLAQIYFKQGKQEQAQQAQQKFASLNRDREASEQKRNLQNRLFQALQ